MFHGRCVLFFTDTGVEGVFMTPPVKTLKETTFETSVSSN